MHFGHINNISSKALRTSGLLWQSLKPADTKTKLIAYYTLIRSRLEYACQTWDPVSNTEVKKLEKIQNKCLRFIFNIRGAASFSKEDTGIPSVQELGKESRYRLFLQSTTEWYNLVLKCRVTRQAPGLYSPSIKNSTYFNSFFQELFVSWQSPFPDIV